MRPLAPLTHHTNNQSLPSLHPTNEAHALIPTFEDVIIMMQNNQYKKLCEHFLQVERYFSSLKGNSWDVVDFVPKESKWSIIKGSIFNKASKLSQEQIVREIILSSDRFYRPFWKKQRKIRDAAIKKPPRRNPSFLWRQKINLHATNKSVGSDEFDFVPERPQNSVSTSKSCSCDSGSNGKKSFRKFVKRYLRRKSIVRRFSKRSSARSVASNESDSDKNGHQNFFSFSKENEQIALETERLLHFERLQSDNDGIDSLNCGERRNRIPFFRYKYYTQESVTVSSCSSCSTLSSSVPSQFQVCFASFFFFF